MIYNIVLLLAANVLIPLIPFPYPQIFVLYNVYDYQTRQVTVYDDMNLTRHYSDQQFKKSFRQSMKKLHPDRGGSQQSFSKVKEIQQIMSQPVNYYDLYNVTNIDLQINQKLIDVVNMRQLLYQFQTVVFYFIALLYILAFTIDDNLKPSRYSLLPLTLVFCSYQFYIHWYPQQMTLIDLLVDHKMPIFLQSLFLKKLFCFLSAYIRTKYLRRKNQQTILLNEIENLPYISQTGEPLAQTKQQKNQIQEKYLNVLSKLDQIYSLKVEKYEKDKKSLLTKIRNYISKGFSFLVIGLIAWNFITQMSTSSSSNPQDWQQSQF